MSPLSQQQLMQPGFCPVCFGLFLLVSADVSYRRAACARTGVLGRRGFAVESAAARICPEAGGRVTTNVLVRDLDLAAPNVRARRLEVVVDGLPLFAGAQLAVDTILVSALQLWCQLSTVMAVQSGCTQQ